MCVTVFLNPQISDHLNNNIHCHNSTQFNLVLAKQRVLKKKKETNYDRRPSTLCSDVINGSRTQIVSTQLDNGRGLLLLRPSVQQSRVILSQKVQKIEEVAEVSGNVQSHSLSGLSPICGASLHLSVTNHVLHNDHEVVSTHFWKLNIIPVYCTAVWDCISFNSVYLIIWTPRSVCQSTCFFLCALDFFLSPARRKQLDTLLLLSLLVTQ